MKKFVISFAALIVALTAFGQVNPNAPLQRDPSVLYGKLDNGLTYYIKHNEKPAQRAEFWFLSDVGAIQETPAQDGLAHFQEHMCLNGTKNLPGKMLISYFESIGAKFGPNINASTGVERTMYMLNNIPTVREGIIDTCLLVMHDYSGFVTNDPAEIDKERGVIIEEWRTRRTSDWRMMEQFYKYLYKDSKYAGCTVIGDKKNLETFPAEELQKFYSTWYRPDLQAIVVVGDINPEEILAKMKKLFSDIPARENPEPKAVINIPDNDKPIVGIITDPEAQITRVQCFIKSQPLPKAYNSLGVGFMVDLMENLINEMFYERIDDIAHRSDAPFLGGQIGFMRMTNTMEVTALAAACKDGEALTAYKALLTEFEKARRYGFTEAEFERAKTNLITIAERNASNAKDRKNMEWVNDYQEDFFNNETAMTPEYRCEQLKGYLQVIPLDQINKIVNATSIDKNFVVTYLAPEREGLVHPSEQDFIDAISEVLNSEIQANQGEEVMEPLLDPSVLKGSKVKKEKAGDFGSTVWILKNGIRVTIRPSDYKKEEVLFSLRANGGTSIIDESDIPSLDDNMLMLYSTVSGVAGFPATKLNKMLTGKIVSVSPYISSIQHGCEGSCAPKDFETMLQLVYLGATQPRFNADELAPVMKQLQAVVPNLEKQPQYIFSTKAVNTLYGNTPRMEMISSEKLGKMSFESLERSYRKLFSNLAGAEAIITGNVDLATIKPLVEKYIGSLPVGKKATSYIGKNDPHIVPGARNEFFTTAMATPKTTCMIAVSGKSKSDLEARMTMNVLKGILDILYTETIREEEGGTYGVSVQAEVNTIPEEFADILISFDTNPENAEKLFALTEAGLRSVAENGPDAGMLSKAKGNLLKNIPENRISNGYWSNVIMSKYNTGIDQDTDKDKVIEGITAEKVRRYAADLLAQGNLVKVMMSPAK